MAGRAAAFVDRDGTLNVEVGYLHRAADLELVAGAAEAIGLLNEAGLVVVVVTNQAGIARGYYDERALHALHRHMSDVLAAAGARVDAFYFCPHHPDFGGPCACRKPAPGMLLQAAGELGLDLHSSWLIGDTLGDIGAGSAAGCRTVLVRTGYGAVAEATLVQQDRARPEVVVDDLGAAVRYVLAARQAGTARDG